tara:strand:- start:5153 stop:5419 length:267 start_codon:yes stop_codon:yes gene_type:complete
MKSNTKSSVSCFYKVCREHPLLVISTPHGIGKYHFNCIGYKNSQLLFEFTLIIDNNFKDSDAISTELGNKYYLNIDQFLLAYKNLAFA